MAAGPGSPEQRLRGWVRALVSAKRAKALDDPELFATYQVLVGENSELIREHLTELEGQLAAVIASGQSDGSFRAGAEPGVLAHAVFQATAHFHDPGYAPEWSRPTAESDLDALLDLVLRGLLS